MKNTNEVSDLLSEISKPTTDAEWDAIAEAVEARKRMADRERREREKGR